AVVNASVLKTMSAKWQKRFLTWGIIIAVFGMRLLFPILIVAITANISPLTVLQIVFQNPMEYARRLSEAHIIIAAFGGMFLFMVFLNYFLDKEKDVHWVKVVENYLILLGKFESIQVVIALLVLLFFSELAPAAARLEMLLSGVLGIIVYVIVGSIAQYMQEKESKALQRSLAGGGLALFLYLEILDASFSFDGVIVAFAITRDIIFITAGLGIGAMFVRSLTVMLVQKKTLSKYRFLEHGAHWAIGALAVIMLLGIKYDIPELLTSLIGAVFLALSLISSLGKKPVE
ncbi:MAG: DUF475 domain-containing protein, partial [Candidatus Margulisbacteria bacterium]|nr:DUF475 domain-containing protein [Candidatus Margulisiibacteriota bacterium]